MRTNLFVFMKHSDTENKRSASAKQGEPRRRGRGMHHKFAGSERIHNLLLKESTISQSETVLFVLGFLFFFPTK